MLLMVPQRPSCRLPVHRLQFREPTNREGCFDPFGGLRELSSTPLRRVEQRRLSLIWITLPHVYPVQPSFRASLLRVVLTHIARL